MTAQKCVSQLNSLLLPKLVYEDELQAGWLGWGRLIRPRHPLIDTMVGRQQNVIMFGALLLITGHFGRDRMNLTF